MGFISKIWKDRKTEYPSRRNLTKEDGSTELVTVARAEGNISEEGDAFSAENMNDLETRIGNAFEEVNSNLTLLNESLSWKVGNTSVGKNGANLPSNYNELLIAFDDGTDYKRTFTVYLPKISFNNNNTFYFYTSNTNARIENNKVYLDYFMFNNNNITNTARTTIYYR